MIGITGANGHLGRTVLEHLRRLKGAGTRVCGFARRQEAVRALAPWVDEARQADFADPASTLASSFSGVHTLLLISIEGEDELRIRLHARAAEAAALAGVKRIVYTSFFDIAPESPSVVARVHRLTEEAIMATGCDWTMLRNGPYVDNVAQRVALAGRANGIFRMAAGDSRMPFIARSDLALAAAHALVSTPSTSAAYRLSGPELLSYQQLADLVGGVLGREVRYQPMSDDEYRGELAAEGLTPELQARRMAYVQAMRQGFMTALTDDFQRLVGHAPGTMAEVVPTLDFSPGKRLH